MGNIYTIGTIHTFKESKNRIEEVFKKRKFDVVLGEGTKGSLNKDLFLIEPFLCFALKIYFWFTNKRGSELGLTEKLAKDNKITYVNMDLTISELIKHFQHDITIQFPGD